MRSKEYTNKILNAVGRKGITEYSKEEQKEFKTMFGKLIASGEKYDTAKRKVKEIFLKSQQEKVKIAQYNFDHNKSVDNFKKLEEEINKLNSEIEKINKKFDYYEKAFPHNYLDPKSEEFLLKLLANNKNKYDNLNPLQKLLAHFRNPDKYEPAKIYNQYLSSIEAVKLAGLNLGESKIKVNKLIEANTEELDGKKIYREYLLVNFGQKKNPNNILEEVNYDLQNDLSKDLKDNEYVSYKEINIFDSYEEIEEAIENNNKVEEKEKAPVLTRNKKKD